MAWDVLSWDVLSYILNAYFSDLFTPTFFAYFLHFLGSKIRTTDHYYRTTHTRKSRFLAKFLFIK